MINRRTVAMPCLVATVLLACGDSSTSPTDDGEAVQQVVDTVVVQQVDTIYMTTVDTLFVTDTIASPNAVWFQGEVDRADGSPDTGAYIEVQITQPFLPVPSPTSVIYTRARDGEYRLGWDSRHCEFGNGTDIRIEIFSGAGEDLAVPVVAYQDQGTFCGQIFTNDFALPY